MKFTDTSLEERIARGEISRQELRDRAVEYYSVTPNTTPFEADGEFGCPVCLSRLDRNNRLVREDGYIVCDYCVNFVEEP